MLNEVIEALETLGFPVVYGRVTNNDIKEEDKWDYFVIKRNVLKRKNIEEYYCEYIVTFVSEKYIPEGFEIDIIETIETKTKLKYMSERDGKYDYATKGKTEDVIEAISLYFKKRIKKCRQ